MADSVKYGAEVFAVMKPSDKWAADAKEQVRKAGRGLELTCPREERVAEFHLGAMILVPSALAPQKDWPVFRVDLGQIMLRGEDGAPVPATFSLMELEQRALTKAKDTHPQLVSMLMTALAEAS